MSTLVDSNVLIDVIEQSSAWHLWSSDRLAEAAEQGSVFINQIVLAETAELFRDPKDFEPFSAMARLVRENLPWEACYQAGAAHLLYRDRGGERDRTLPDFFIGAHAQVSGHRLLTRDPRRYRQYFPDVEVIAPDTHP